MKSLLLRFFATPVLERPLRHKKIPLYFRLMCALRSARIRTRTTRNLRSLLEHALTLMMGLTRSCFTNLSSRLENKFQIPSQPLLSRQNTNPFVLPPGMNAFEAISPKENTRGPLTTVVGFPAEMIFLSPKLYLILIFWVMDVWPRRLTIGLVAQVSA